MNPTQRSALLVGLVVLIAIALVGIYLPHPAAPPLSPPQTPADQNDTNAAPSPNGFSQFVLPQPTPGSFDRNQFIAKLCNDPASIPGTQYPAEKYPQKVQQCGDNYVIYPPQNATNPPFIFIDQQYRVLGSCEQKPNAIRLMAECPIPCAPENLCHNKPISPMDGGGIANPGQPPGADGEGGEGGTPPETPTTPPDTPPITPPDTNNDQINLENYIRTDDPAYCELIEDPQLREYCFSLGLDDDTNVLENFEAVYTSANNTDYNQIEIYQNGLTFRSIPEPPASCQDWTEPTPCYLAEDVSSQYIVLTTTDLNRLVSLISEINFVVLDDAYNTNPPVGDSYDQQLYVKLRRTEKMVTYTTYQDAPAAPESFDIIKTELFELVRRKFGPQN